jgi:putative ABC transport system substrate-binding protein
MRRREFITLLGSALAWPITARAQHVGKRRIAFITHVPRDIIYEPLFEDLRELGYVEGQNIIIERQYAEGKPERFQEFAAEMVRLNVDLIITTTTPAALAARNATMTIPIVIPTAIDPCGHWADRESRSPGRQYYRRRDSHWGNGG